MGLPRVLGTLVLVCSVPVLTSCLARQRAIPRIKSAATQKLLTADKEALLQILRGEFQQVDSLSATVDMVPSLGSVNKGKITEYKDFLAFIRYKKPVDMRIIGLIPVVRTTAFDMLANGSDFKLYLPTKELLIEGRNEPPEKPSPNKLENMRPAVFLDALFIPPPAPDEIVYVKDFTDEDNAVYQLQIFDRTPDGQIRGERDVWFDRLNLHIRRQVTFDAKGEMLSDVRYSGWKTRNGVPFPNVIDLNRPKDEYGVVMTVQKIDINKPIAENQFVMEPPPKDTKVKILGGAPSTSAEGSSADGSSASRLKSSH